MDALNGRAGGDAELVAQQHPQAVVGEQRLGDISTPLERLHQDPVAGLAVGSKLDQLACAIFGLRERGAAEAKHFTKHTVARKHNTVPCRYWDDSGPYALLKVKPRRCTLGGTYGYQQVDLVKMRWRSWMGDRAYGRGIGRANMGVSSKVRVKLYRPRRWEENTYRFTRARFNFGYGWSRPLILRVN